MLNAVIPAENEFISVNIFIHPPKINKKKEISEVSIKPLIGYTNNFKKFVCETFILSYVFGTATDFLMLPFLKLSNFIFIPNCSKSTLRRI